MDREIEIRYLNVNHDEIRKKLIGLDFVQTQESREYNCRYFHFEKDVKNKRRRWARLKDDGQGHVLMGVKEVLENKIGGVGEIDIYIDNFEKGKQFFYALGMVDRAKHTIFREIWKKEDENVEVTLDKWNHLKPNIEIESDSEEKLKKYSQLLGLDFKKAIY